MPKKQPSAFEKYAHEYDLMTDADKREPNHLKEVDAMISRFKPSRVLDAGCATGLTTVLFAERGVEAVGLDRSKPMIAMAREKAARRNVDADFLVGNFEKLPVRLNNSFDLIVCLANAISGVDTIAALSRSLSGFRRLLRPGGTLVVQMLNYAAIADGQLFPVKATHNDGIVYERFSERRGKTLSIYLSRTDLRQSPPTLEIFRHDFDNFTVDQMVRRVVKAGFEKLHKFGDLKLTSRFSQKKRDLIITAQRPAK